jgi:uncharacterized membrane-anchored protein
MGTDTDLTPPASSLPADEADRLMAVLGHAVSEIHPDLQLVLTTGDADALADRIFGDEVHHPGT